MTLTPSRQPLLTLDSTGIAALDLAAAEMLSERAVGSAADIPGGVLNDATEWIMSAGMSAAILQAHLQG